MNHAIKNAIVRRCRCAGHDELGQRLQLFVDEHVCDRRLKTLRGSTLCESTVQAWTKQPQRFRLDPSNHMPRANN